MMIAEENRGKCRGRSSPFMVAWVRKDTRKYKRYFLSNIRPKCDPSLFSPSLRLTLFWILFSVCRENSLLRFSGFICGHFTKRDLVHVDYSVSWKEEIIVSRI